MSATIPSAFDDLLMLFDILHNRLGELEDGMFDLAEELFDGRGKPRHRGKVRYNPLREYKRKVKDAKADRDDDQEHIECCASPIKPLEERGELHHAETRADVSGQQRRHRGLPKPREPDHEPSQNPDPPSRMERVRSRTPSRSIHPSRKAFSA